MEFDFTEIREYNKVLLFLQGISPNYIDMKCNLYYDETGNVKKFIIRENCFNVDADTHFVLGGIEGHSTISFEDLKNRLDMQTTVNEVKSKHIYNGAFESCLKSSKLEKFLDLIIERRWHIHFQSLNLVYWSVVDILDSIKDIDISKIYHLKAVLYQVIKSNTRNAIDIFNRYTYPDLKSGKDVSNFMNSIRELCLAYIDKCSEYHKELLDLLIKILEKGRLQSEAIFIQNEDKSVLIKDFSEFYAYEIYTFINSNIVLDNEADIVNYLNENKFVIEGRNLTNYKFVDSKSDTMIQISDVIVGLIAKYLHAIDRNSNQIIDYISQFDDEQLRRFRKLNKIIKYSLKYNPAFIHQTTSIELHNLFISLVELYRIE